MAACGDHSVGAESTASVSAKGSAGVMSALGPTDVERSAGTAGLSQLAAASSVPAPPASSASAIWGAPPPPLRLRLRHEPSGSAEDELQAADAFVKAGLDASVASATSTTYNSHVRAYLTYCERIKLEPWPASYATLSRWMADHVLGRRLSPHTLGTMLSAVRAFASTAVASKPPGSFDATGLDANCLRLSPQERIFLTRLQRGLERIARQPVEHKMPVRRFMLDEAEAALRKKSADGGLSPRDSMALLMCRVAQRLLLRVGEYSGAGVLLRSDIADKGDRLIFSIREAKTAGPGEVQVVELRDPDLVAQMRALISRRKAAEAVFQSFVGNVETGSAATRHYVTSQLRELVNVAGYPADDYSSHSLRAGGATDLAFAGATWPDLMRMGRWRSAKTPLVYIAAADDFNARLARLVVPGKGEGGADSASHRPAGLAGPSLCPWRNEEEKVKFIEEIRAQMRGAVGVVAANALAAELQELPATSSPIAPVEDRGAAAADDTCGASSGAGVSARKRSRAGTPVSDRVVDTLADRRWERYLWQKQAYNDKIIGGGKPGQRQQNALDNLREVVAAGLDDAHARGDNESAALWSAERALWDA